MLETKKRRTIPAGETTLDYLLDEVLALCPTCKAFETLWFAGDRLRPTRKFNQSGDRVYHDCGSKEPCRLYRTY